MPVSRRAGAAEVAIAVRTIAACHICRRRAAGGRLIVGDGNPRADVVFVGEAPGRQEVEAGKPFVGPAGRWLRQAITLAGLTDLAVYFTNVVPYRPASGVVRAEDIDHGREHVIRLLEVIRPRLVVLLGATACRGLLDERIAVNRRHGSFIARGRVHFFVTFHPAAPARFPAARRKTLADFRRLSAWIHERNFASGHVKYRRSAEQSGHQRPRRGHRGGQGR